MLPLCVLSSLPSSFHLLHHEVLLLKRGFLALHRRLVLLQHGIALLGQSSSHCLDRPSQVLPIALRGGGGAIRGGAITLDTQKEPSELG